MYNLCFAGKKRHLSKSPCEVKAQGAILDPTSKLLLPPLLIVAPQ